jgi:hypothetical protein
MALRFFLLDVRCIDGVRKGSAQRLAFLLLSKHRNIDVSLRVNPDIV